MDLVVGAFWVATALGGAYMLALTVTRGRDAQGAVRSHLPSFAVAAHASAAGLFILLWVVYASTREEGWGWAALAAVVLTVAGGSLLFLRWLRDRHGQDSEHNRATLAEQQIPSSVVHLHGALAAATLGLTLLAVLGVG